jgi:hypothetical protein
MNPTLWRQRELARVRGKLLREQSPRLQMALIVSLTGLAGLAASFVMLHAGLTSMGPRYLLAMVFAYGVFMLLLWAWLRLRGDAGDGGGDLPLSSDSSDAAAGGHFGGGGGSFDGGGASGDYDLAGGLTYSLADIAVALPVSSGKRGRSVDLDVGDAAIPIAVALLVAGIAFSSLFVVYTAPALFSELLVDGVLAAGLYRRLRGMDRRHWLHSAVRRTFWPFVLTAAVVAGAGWMMGHYAPEAHSIGQVFEHRRAMQDQR